MASVMYLQFNNQKEDNTKHTKGKCHIFPPMINMLTIV